MTKEQTMSINPEVGATNAVDFPSLSVRQREAAILAVQGKTNKKIAGELVISERTVKEDLGGVFKVLNIHNRTALIGKVPPSFVIFSQEEDGKETENVVLTPRQKEILDIVSSGAGNEAIARILKISPRTVQAHLSEVFRKLKAGSRTETVFTGMKLELENKLKTKKKNPDELMPREKVVLECLSGGLSNEEIAGELDNEVTTVRHHISRIIEKLRVGDRVEAAVKHILSQPFGKISISPEEVGKINSIALFKSKQREVLEQIAQGKTSKEIAYFLGIEERTVKSHITNIFSILNVDTRLQAAIIWAKAEQIRRSKEKPVYIGKSSEVIVFRSDYLASQGVPLRS